MGRKRGRHDPCRCAVGVDANLLAASDIAEDRLIVDLIMGQSASLRRESAMTGQTRRRWFGVFMGLVYCAGIGTGILRAAVLESSPTASEMRPGFPCHRRRA